MSTRRERIEESLRRSVADLLVFGELRDPRLQRVGCGVTGVRVTPDLMQARIFVDITGEAAAVSAALVALNASAPVIRAEIGKKMHIRRLPQLRFERDESIEEGLRIEQALAAIRAEELLRAKNVEGAGEGES